FALYVAHCVPTCFPSSCLTYVFFFFNDTAPPEIYTLSLHDALPIFFLFRNLLLPACIDQKFLRVKDFFYIPLILLHKTGNPMGRDRKSTRLNSSHVKISYAVFCLKKKITKIVDSSETE